MLRTEVNSLLAVKGYSSIDKRIRFNITLPRLLSCGSRFVSANTPGSESLCKVAMALLLMFPGWAHAQPLELQIRAATNDKIQRNMTPFAIALKKVLGEAFVEEHKPIFERRRPCKWSDKWEECSYLALRRNDATEGEIQAIQNVMRNPCPHVTADQQVHASAQKSSAERRPTRKASSIDNFCRSGFFRTAGLRQAERSVFSSKKEQQLQQAGALEFEALVLGVSN